MELSDAVAKNCHHSAWVEKSSGHLCIKCLRMLMITLRLCEIRAASIGPERARSGRMWKAPRRSRTICPAQAIRANLHHCSPIRPDPAPPVLICPTIWTDPFRSDPTRPDSCQSRLIVPGLSRSVLIRLPDPSHPTRSGRSLAAPVRSGPLRHDIQPDLARAGPNRSDLACSDPAPNRFGAMQLGPVGAGPIGQTFTLIQDID